MDPRPPFLDLLDENPERAAALLRLFIVAATQRGSPSIVRSIAPDDRDDWVQTFVVHLWEGDFRRLRKYRDEGHRFSSWYHVVATNHARAFLKRRRDQPIPRPSDADAERELLDHTPAPLEDVSDDHDRRRVAEGVRAAMDRLDDDCKIILAAKAEGRPPRQIAALFPGVPAKPSIYEQIRTCLRRLQRMLESMNFDFNLLGGELESEKA
jgi:RNA polymerase sigma factor (sigma-70 family)